MCFDANLEPDFDYDNITKRKGCVAGMYLLIASYIVVQPSGSFFKYVIKRIVYLGNTYSLSCRVLDEKIETTLISGSV